MRRIRYSIGLLLMAVWTVPMAAQESTGSAQQVRGSNSGAAREKVTGIGGFFFRAKDPKEYPNGRFARIHDPEGNPIELWEPRTPSTGR